MLEMTSRVTQHPLLFLPVWHPQRLIRCALVDCWDHIQGKFAARDFWQRLVDTDGPPLIGQIRLFVQFGKGVFQFLEDLDRIIVCREVCHDHDIDILDVALRRIAFIRTVEEWGFV